MKIKKILPIIGIIIFIYIIYSIGLNKIWLSFTNFKALYLIPAVFFIIINYLLLTYKWKEIIKQQGFNFTFFESFMFYLKGNFYGFITPSRSGSIIRAVYLKEKTGKSLIECGSGIIIERGFDLLSILILASIGAIFVANYFAGLLITLVLVLLGLIILIILFANKKRARLISSIFYKFLIPKKLKEKARNSFYSFYESIPSVKKLIYPFILTILTWIIAYTHLYFFALAFQINIPYLIFIILIPISTIIGLIPITMSGLGTREATIITLFKIFNIPPELTLSMSLTGLIIGAAIPAFIGFLLTLKKS